MFKRYFVLSAVVLGMALGLSLALYRTRETSRVQVESPSPREENALLSTTTTTTNNYNSITANSNSTVVVTNATPVVVTNASPLPANLNPQTTNAVKRPASRPRRAPTTYAPDVPKSRQVLLANRRIVVKEGRSFPKTFSAAQSPTARGTAPYIVISELPVSRDVRIQATADGAKVIGFLPNNALLVEADAQALKNLENDVLFMAAVEYEPTDKIQRNLLDAKPDESVEATIVLLNEADRATVESFVTAEGGKMVAGTSTAGKAIMADVPSSVITKLAGKAEVKWIEKYGRLKLLNDQAVLPQVMNVTPVWNTHGLTGEGQIIASMDSGIDKGSMTDINADFTGQIVEIAQFSSGDYHDYTGHGTHTAGSLVGLGTNSSGKFKGVAHGAKLLVQSACSKEHTFSPYREDESEYFIYKRKEWGYGVRSDSWGAEDSYEYDSWCALCDDCIWNDPELLDVLAAGNDGGFYSPDSSIDSPASAKNVLAVGASRNRRYTTKDTPTDNEIYDISTYSSLGPTADGRIKPDICAPGEFVVSIKSQSSEKYLPPFDTSDKYVYNSGTSMATPLTAGCAALVREWLMKHKGYAETKPTAALMKAILTGGAYDISDKAQFGWLYGKCPSYFQGWGRVDLEASIFPTNGLAVYMKDRLPFDRDMNFVFTVTTTNPASLRAQLVWIDHAAEQLAGPMINNDLDLVVSSAATGEEKIWYGNGGKTPDELNTVESVRIENAAAGRYIVRVTCSAIPYPYDEGGAAAIYIRGAFDPDSITEISGTDAQIAAQLSPSQPVLLVNAGTSTKPATKDNWIVKDVSGGTQFSFEDGDISASGSFGGGMIWNHTSLTPFSKDGAFTNIYGQVWSSVEEEMLVSLGLRGTKESDLSSFYQSGFENGQGRGCSITISGLSVGKRYVLHYMTDGGSSKKSSSFTLKASGCSGTPTIDYVKGSDKYYSPLAVSKAITAAANEPLLVRVSNLQPNAQGKVVIDVGGATVNVLAIAEMPSPLLYYIAQGKVL